MARPSRPSGYYLLLCGAFLWCVSLFVPPLVAVLVSADAARYCYATYSTICHQFPSRSLHVFGHPLAVCSRCSGIYFGFLAGVLVAPFASRRVPLATPHTLLLAAAPMLIDVLTDAAGLSHTTLATRLITGEFFGILSAIALTPLFEDACADLLPETPQL